MIAVVHWLNCMIAVPETHLRGEVTDEYFCLFCWSLLFASTVDGSTSDWCHITCVIEVSHKLPHASSLGTRLAISTSWQIQPESAEVPTEWKLADTTGVYWSTYRVKAGRYNQSLLKYPRWQYDLRHYSVKYTEVWNWNSATCGLLNTWYKPW